MLKETSDYYDELAWQLTEAGYKTSFENGIFKLERQNKRTKRFALIGPESLIETDSGLEAQYRLKLKSGRKRIDFSDLAALIYFMKEPIDELENAAFESMRRKDLEFIKKIS